MARPIAQCPLWVKSGHVQCNSVCPLCANSRLMHCSKMRDYSMTSSARRRNDSTDPLVSAVVHFAELNEIMAACAADAARACDPAQRSASATQHIIDGAIDGLGLAQRNHSPRAGMSVFLVRRHGLSPRQNGDEFHHQQAALNCPRASLRYAPAHETDLSVNSIHWFSDQRAHPRLHINFASSASSRAATIDSSASTSRQQER